ncbi:hypothetical protein LCGC14_2512190 [marine sediment metagenome]|uniref:Uncharacterized protein n=1 Tax=marine sediment metagenome TaxID=412755 RepID=A0A0F9AYU7_9ZZZZ
MKKTKLKVPLVAVVWRDACHAMNPGRDNTEPPWVVDCGFVVKQNKDYLVLVRQFFDDGAPRHSMTILKDNIEEIQRVGTATLPIHFVSAPFLGDSSE